MAFKTGIIFCTLVLACLAAPAPENDVTEFFVESRSARIVGGRLAPPGSHPWMVALSSGSLIRSFFCGASVINRRTILTAAHCIDGIRGGNNLARTARASVGTNRWRQESQLLSFAGFAMHTQYNGGTIKNDIGTLFTATDIIYTNLVQPIPLDFGFVGEGVSVRVAGWGGARANGRPQAELLEIDTTTIDGEQCVTDVQKAGIRLNMRPPPVDPRIEICTFHAPGVGTCRGDSGSALVRNDNRQQVGVVSWGFPCARGAPDVFVRVSAFRSWIHENSQF